MKKSFITLLFVMVAIFSKAQTLSSQVMSSGGDYFGASGYSLSWTLGETAVSFFGMSNGSLSAGYQQPDNATVTLVSDYNLAISEKISVAPNPAINEIYLFIKDNEHGNIRLQIQDLRGKLLYAQDVCAGMQSSSIQISQLPPAPYFITLRTEDGSIFSTLKFIKQ